MEGETLLNRSQTPIRRTWALSYRGGHCFSWAVIVVASVYWGIVTRGDAQAIAEQTPKAMPVMLVAVQLLLPGVFCLGILWSGTPGLVCHRLAVWNRARCCGGRLRSGSFRALCWPVLYFTVLSPAMMPLQRNVGDYVPPGELTGALVGNGPRAVLPSQCPAPPFR